MKKSLHFGRYDYAAFSTFFTYAAGSVVIPVALVLLAEELGFPLESGGLVAGGALQVARTLPMVVAMLSCAFLAGRWGKRNSFGVSVLVMSAGVLLCALTPSYSILFVGLLIAGFGEGVIEGLATPLIQDLHVNDEPGRYINFAHSFWAVGVLVTVLISGFLLSVGVSWRYLIGGVAVLGFLTAITILLPEREGHKYPEHKEPVHWRETRNNALKIMRTPKFWLFFAAMFVAGGGEFCLTFWCASYIQLSFGEAAWAGGVGTAAFAGGMVLGRMGCGILVKQQYFRRLIILSALAGTVISLSFPFIENLWLLFVLLFFVGIASAPYWPSIQSYASDRMPEVDSTMLLILLSCAGVPGCGVATYLMGIIGNVTGDLRTAFFLVPFCYFTLAILIICDRRKTNTHCFVCINN